MTNVHGKDYGTHIDGPGDRTLCKRYLKPKVNRVGAGEEARATCKICQRIRLNGGKPRPRQVIAGDPLALYTAMKVREEATPWGVYTAWTITRLGVVVGSMFQGTAGYGNRVHCSMTKLVHSGSLPEGCSNPNSPHYGIHFDTGPHDTRELALQDFAKRADRLIAWRELLGIHVFGQNPEENSG